MAIQEVAQSTDDPMSIEHVATYIPIGSMYGIYANIWGIWMVNVTIYSSTMDLMGNVDSARCSKNHMD